MIAVDTNVLVYAHRRDSPFHPLAARALRSLAEGTARWAIPWPCVYEFYAVVTRLRIYNPPSTPAEALGQIDRWLRAPTLTVVGEDQGYWPSLRDVVAASGVIGGMVHDARIAALCLRNGVTELWSGDRDFSRFPALRVRNPLVG